MIGKLYTFLLCVVIAALVPVSASAAPRSAEDIAREGRALVGAALLRYADGKRGTALDRTLATALDRRPGARAAAKRLAGRLRARPAKATKRVLGRHASQLERVPTSAALQEALTPVWISPLAQGAVHWLPAEKLIVPEKIDVTLAGLHCSATQDGDGTDEVAVLTRIIRRNGDAISVAASFDSDRPVHIAAGTTKPLSGEVTLTNTLERLFVTGVVEVDGGGAQAQDELALAFELALGLAQDVGGDDPLGALQAALEYTEGVLALANPGTAPSLRAVKLDPSAIEGLYGATASHSDAIEHKLTLAHAVGGASYEVLFDVPAPPVALPSIRVLTTWIHAPQDVLPAGGHLTLLVTIDGETHERVLPPGKAEATLNHDVRRKVVGDDPVEIELRLRWDGVAPSWGSWSKKKKTNSPFKPFVKKKYYCGSPPAQVKAGLEENGYKYMGPCKKPGGWVSLGTARTKMTYDPKTDELSKGGVKLRASKSGYLLSGKGSKAGEVRFFVSGS